MYSFFVLGIIPGTNIQISFQAWLIIAAVITWGAYAAKGRLQQLRLVATPARQPLHASQLHQRVQ